MDVQALSSRILRFTDDSNVICKVCRKSFPLVELIEHSLADHYYQCYSAVHCAACEQAFFVPCQRNPSTRGGVQMTEARKIYVRMFVVHSTLCLLRYNQAAVNLFCETLRDNGLVNDISSDNTSTDRSLMDPGTLKSFPIAPDSPKESINKDKATSCTSCTIM